MGGGDKGPSGVQCGGLMGDMTHAASCWWGLPRGKVGGGVEVMQRGQHANFEPFGKIKEQTGTSA